MVGYLVDNAQRARIRVNHLAHRDRATQSQRLFHSRDFEFSAAELAKSSYCCFGDVGDHINSVHCHDLEQELPRFYACASRGVGFRYYAGERCAQQKQRITSSIAFGAACGFMLCEA